VAETRITIEELVELTELELAAKGETLDDTTRSLRARLTALRAGETPSRRSSSILRSPSTEARLQALEDEVKRLRELIEGGQNNG
jgi:hypothetical protein